jgi:uncharacterized membrane protein YfcA
MSAAVLTLFLLATFLGGVTSGVAGFAMGLVMTGICLHILTPMQTASLIAGYGFVTQGYAIWKFRDFISWKGAAPFIIGGAIGVPIGTALLTYIDPDVLRVAIGVMLVLYSIWGLSRASGHVEHENVGIDAGVGALNGVLGGLTGLSGIIIVIWCQLRNWSKDRQRGIFQPVLFSTMLMTTVSLSVAGALTPEFIKLYLLGLPCMAFGTWVGIQLYGKLDDAAFRRIVLILLLVSGVSLVVPFSWFG